MVSELMIMLEVENSWYKKIKGPKPGHVAKMYLQQENKLF